MKRIIKPADYLYYPSPLQVPNPKDAFMAVQKLPAGLVLADKKFFPVVHNYRYNPEKGRFDVTLGYAVDNSIPPFGGHDLKTLEFELNEQTLSGLDCAVLPLSEDAKSIGIKPRFRIKEYLFEFDESKKYVLFGMNKIRLNYLATGQMYKLNSR